MENKIFAPPTQEELDKTAMFAAPTPEELHATSKDIVPATNEEPSKPSEYSMLESAILGAVQGGTLGFSDEAEAGVRSALSSRKYDDLIKEIRDRYKSAQEQNPLSYGTGELASAFAVPVPGMGTAKGASLLARLASATGKGALIGGTTGLDWFCRHQSP